jgi:acyl-CoA synthetase (AMP-forming)/AMP-acid ligase II
MAGADICMTLIANSFYRAGQQLGSATAHFEGDLCRSWAETVERTLRLASGLARLGLAPGARVAILAFNGIAYFELSHALLLSGLVMVPLNTRLALAELQEQLADCGAGALAVDATFLETGRALQAHQPAIVHLLLMGAGGGDTGLEELVAAGRADEPAPRPPAELAAILYTGGTTGRPKGVMLSHASLDHDLGLILADIGWPRGVRYLHVSPMFHLADLGPCWAATALLGSHVWMPRFSIDAMLDLLRRHDCTAVALVPSMIALMLDHLAVHPTDLPHLRHIGYGAAAIGRPLLERLRARFSDIALVQFYGQTEAGGSLTCLRAEDHVADSSRLASAGRPHAGCRVRIVRSDGSEAARGEVGEIVGTSGGVFTGYLNQPAASAAAVREGWLHTGDAGFMDEDGYVHVTDRLKDMIVTGGENVASSEVEAVLMRHADVAMAAVLARPHPIWGEAVHAVVVPRTGVALSEAALIAHCRTAIAGYKCPRNSKLRGHL